MGYCRFCATSCIWGERERCKQQLFCTKATFFTVEQQASLAQVSRNSHEGVEVCAAHPLGGQLHHGLGPQQGLAPEPVVGVGRGGGGLGVGENVPVVGVHAVPHLHRWLHLLPLSNQSVSLKSLQPVHSAPASPKHEAEPHDVVVLGHRRVVHPALPHVHP